MTKAIFLLLVCLLPAGAQTQISVVSAANYQATVAPASLATIFGGSLAATAQSASLDSRGQLPTELAGTSVTFDGQLASLTYVSPGQINLVVPDGIAAATSAVVVNTPTARIQGTAAVRRVAPGLFSILNAVTYAAGPFLVETPENGGGDKRTRLAVYGTGIRLADATKIRAQVRRETGALISLAVEFAGAAPGFPGLDQVNLVLPPEADGLGNVDLSLIAETFPSNAVSITVGSLPANRIALAGLTVSAPIVSAGDAVSAVVSLNAPAPAGGVQVQLRSTAPAVAQVPMIVTVLAGQVTAEAPIQTSSPTSAQDVEITASAGGVNKTATLHVNRANTPSLANVSVNNSSITGGGTITGTVTLSGNTQFGGSTVAIQSDNAALVVPASVTVPSGQITANFTAASSAVPDVTAAKITASLDGVVKTAAITLNPLFLLKFNADSIAGGSDGTGSITLSDTAPLGGANVQLQTSDVTVARPPTNVIIPAGQTIAQFTIQTTPPVGDRTVSITATYQGLSQTKPLKITSGLQGTINKLTISLTAVKGGTPVVGTVTLSRAAGAGGTRVMLSSDTILAASVDMFVTVPAGQTTATFSVRTSPVTTPRTVTITASAGNSSQSATFTVN